MHRPEEKQTVFLYPLIALHSGNLTLHLLRTAFLYRPGKSNLAARSQLLI